MYADSERILTELLAATFEIEPCFTQYDFDLNRRR